MKNIKLEIIGLVVIVVYLLYINQPVVSAFLSLFLSIHFRFIKEEKLEWIFKFLIAINAIYIIINNY